LNTKKFTRRQVFATAGITAGTYVISHLLAKKSFASEKDGKKSDFPWTYAKLDPDVTAERAYNIIFPKGCMYAVFTSIVGQLAENFGEPYKSFPFDMMAYGAGGIQSWGSLCGALNGATAVISLFAPSDKCHDLTHELLRWHEKTPLPVYMPKKPRLEMEIPTSIANSELCHISAGNWYRSSGYKLKSKPQHERCIRLSADIAKKTVELLNSCFDGTFVPKLSSPQVKSCKECHNIKSETKIVRGEMNCTTCHSSLGDNHPDLKLK